MGLKELRLKKGLTQQQLAKKVSSANQQRISAYESGLLPVENMTLKTALQICDALGVSNPRKLLPDSKPDSNE
ncbi:helix-turn-helix transcriptional regulator [Bifidobacterium choloepi]|uniref:Helix-turn-helix transcriptional regulator n=1 Tax=Bifidobacterium choloepi TaxID=2614131 RepID=A0A6I5NHW2_9BIFI|nr:helix-turn-helix transcriptional regulator [Bifidobacterium choloepi]NEG69923.1 helix-turn-helix transcriptional regulator [Bifidobacterium choloepi]